MPGLNLRGGASVGYSPMTPAAAITSTGNGMPNATVSQMAYGINGTGATHLESAPTYISVGAGLAAVAILVFIWYSLPR